MRRYLKLLSERENMKHLFTVLAFLVLTLGLAGCDTPPKIKTVVETKTVAVTLDDKHYETAQVPLPPAKDTVAGKSTRDIIAIQATYIQSLSWYIDSLIRQINGIRAASLAAAEKIQKDPSK